MILLLFSSSYPYDSAVEQSFLEMELLEFKKEFSRIVIVPKSCSGNRLPVLEGIEVDESFAGLWRWSNRILFALLSVFSAYFYKDIFRRGLTALSPEYLIKLTGFLSGAFLTRNWVNGWFEKEQVSPSECVFYTYWFTEISMGIGMAKYTYPDIRLVSRVHGYDLYEEMYGAWPCRYDAIDLVDGLFPDSLAGEKYLGKKYPEFRKRYHTALLGVKDPGKKSLASNDGVFRIISCAIPHPVKRIDLLIDGLAFAARLRPEHKFEWRHFGNGTAIEYLNKKMVAVFPSNVLGRFPGYTTAADLIQEYQSVPVDLFMNVSRTEGTPVSIMEAISCGIPVVATAVGGNVEVVSETNGFLLSQNPSVEEIANYIVFALEHPEIMKIKREGSRVIWNKHYNADSNFREFCGQLMEIRRN